MSKKLTKKHLRIIIFAVFIVVLAAFLVNYQVTTKPKEERFKIIDAHEHIESLEQVKTMLSGMDSTGIESTVLLGSPIETIQLSGSHEFTRYDENNEELLKIVKAYPGKFLAFCMIDPRDADKLEKLKNCLADGGTGLKLYTGHGFYYDTFGMALDDPAMDEVYQYCADNRVPIMWHVNAGKYLPEFENVLKKYSNLVVDCPHFCLLSLKPNELSRLFETYPNLYTDISFGYVDYSVAGLKRLSKDPEKYREFFRKYANRIMFGTDEVLTRIAWKDEAYMEARFWCYRDMLEQETYSCPLVDEFEIDNGRPPLELNGLSLGKDILQTIYQDTPKKFLGMEF